MCGHVLRLTSMISAKRAVNRTVTAIGPVLDRAPLPGLRSSLTRGLTVFIFHEVTDSPSEFHRHHRTYTSPEVFRQQLSWITDRFTVVAPTYLAQLGGSGHLPQNAALLSFDDSWAGIFRVALPILRESRLPAICFVNMGTVKGDPDLAAVRGYEVGRTTPSDLARMSSIDLELGERLIADVRVRYGDDASFRAYEGPTATADDLEEAARSGYVWFGSHLYHHWNIRTILDDLYAHSLAANSAALSEYDNALPAFAPPHGYAGEDGRDLFSIASQVGTKVIFTGRGTQNGDATGNIIDRVFFPPETAGPRSWWHATHLARIVGPRVG
jgi:peptidoglycan/xylan/chitin deacetylase (PgdA/CDA1 family)